MANIQRSFDVRFFSKVRNFPENLYKISDRHSLIFKFLYALLENGVGQLKGIQDLANMSQSDLGNTEGTDLDEFYQIFGIRRDAESSYKGSIYEESNIEGIQEYQSGDSRFRIRISKFLQALQSGATKDGIRLIAEASSGYPVHVIEPWHDANRDARLSTINETTVFVMVDKIITEKEKFLLKSKVINGLEMIRPVGALFTVIIVVPEDSSQEINPNYASAGSFMFLSDGSNQHVELLSQEGEIEINGFVVEANPFSVDDSYSTLMGNLIADGDLDTSLVVNETLDIKSPVFFVLLTDGVDSEVVLVYNRFSFNQDGDVFYVYEVTRAQYGTKQIDWNEKTNVTIQTNLTKIDSSAEDEDEDEPSGQPLPIPLADSPDNYPNGKYEGDPTKYDANGNYIFEWSSQEEFEAWFFSQIYDANGQIITDGFYQYLAPIRLRSGSTLIAALYESGGSLILRPDVRPKNND